MDEIKYPVLMKKNDLFVREKWIYFDVNKKSTKTKIKKWIEGFFGVKIIKMNSHWPSK